MKMRLKDIQALDDAGLLVAFLLDRNQNNKRKQIALEV